MRVALVQFDTRSREKARNLQSIEELMASVECDLVVLPEMFATGYDMEAQVISEPSDASDTLEWMKTLSATKRAAVIGTIATSERGSFYNRLYFCLPNGECYHYDKRHLFTFAGEDEVFTAGKERIVVQWCGLRILPLVCYDVRFPAWSYLPGEVDLITYSASWAASRIGAWDKLLPARAVENQAWCVGVNRVGSDKDGVLYLGHSAAYDHLGRKMADCGEREGVVVVDIDEEKISSFRTKFKAWQDADKIQIK